MNIAIIAGSNHAKSSGTKAARYMEVLLRERGHAVFFHELYRQPLPFFSPEDVSGNAGRLSVFKQSIANADAVILVTPEYHGGISGVLKNALDHLGAEHFEGKAVLSVSASGGSVGVSSLMALQTIVRNLHGVNATEWVSVGGEFRTFRENGEPAHEAVRERIKRALRHFVQLAEALDASNKKAYEKQWEET